MYGKKIRGYLTVLVLVGLVISGIVGVLQAQRLHSECVSKTSQPEVECAPADVLMTFFASFYIAVFLAVALPLALMARYILLGRKKDKLR